MILPPIRRSHWRSLSVVSTMVAIVGSLVSCGEKSPEQWSLDQEQRDRIKSDISWFAKVEGYPELVYKHPSLAAVLTKPEKVFVSKVEDGGSLKLGQYELEHSRIVSERDAGYFSTIMTSPTSMTAISACVFSPGFAIRFDGGGRSFFALVCYSCGDISIVDESDECVGKWGMTHEAAFALLNKFQELFPDDPEVQNLRF